MSVKAASQIQVNSSTGDTDFHRLSNDDDNDNRLRNDSFFVNRFIQIAQKARIMDSRVASGT